MTTDDGEESIVVENSNNWDDVDDADIGLWSCFTVDQVG